jgi:hypothetical protein
MTIEATMTATPGWRAALERAFYAIDADIRRRLSLIGLAIVLQGLVDSPRDALRAAVGPKLGLAVMAALLASIILLFIAALAPAHKPARWLTPLALGACLLAALIGARQMVVMGVASVTPTIYVNDGTTLDHQAALDFTRGLDPYETTTLTAGILELHQSSQFATPLRRGVFANRNWLDYPSGQDLQRVMPGTDAKHPPLEVEAHVSYPALAFLALVPFVALGLPSVILASFLCVLALGYLAWRIAPPAYRPWALLLLLADVPLLNSALTGSLDVLALLLVVVAWALWPRVWLSAVIFGLALAAKQQPWFFIPFFAIFLYYRVGWRETLKRLGVSGGVFLAINAPFMLHDAHAWAQGVLAPALDPMFPRGEGLVQLALAGTLPLFSQPVYTALEALAMLACVGWYAWRGVHKAPETAFVLALLPLWFAWRSLPSYFYFSAWPLALLWLAWRVKPAPDIAPEGGH